MANNDDSIDIVVVGGDITTGLKYDTKEAAIADTQTALAPLKNCKKPVIVLKGNHDDNSYHTMRDDKPPLDPAKIVSDKLWREQIIEYVNNEEIADKFVYNTEVDNSAYFYYDVTKGGKTTRVIALNASDLDLTCDENGVIANMPQSVYQWQTDGENEFHWAAGYSRYGYSSRQIKWLADVALADFNGDVIFLSHQGIDGHSQSRYQDTAVTNSEALRNIINAYQNKTAYNGTLDDVMADYDAETDTYVKRATMPVSVDFSGKTGKALVFQYGHTHKEMINYYTTANIWEINTATCNYVNASADNSLMHPAYPWNSASPEQRTANNDTACFDIVSAGSNVVYKFNIGFGTDATLVVPR